MSAGTEAIRALREAIWANGFRPMAVHTAKIGDPSTGKNPLGDKWQIGAKKDPPEIIELGTVVNYALNTGVLCDGLRVIDFDIDDAAMVNKAAEAAFAILGVTMLRIRSNSPRCMAVYKAAEGEPRKLVSTGATHSKTVACKVEVLGRGQQFVAYGQHWSGAELQWPGGGPADQSIDSIPVVTDQQVMAFLAACAPIINAVVPTPPKKPSANGHDTSVTADQGDLFAALHLTPNAGAPDWEAWNAVGMAIWASTEGSAEGWAMWRDWSAKNPADDPEATLERWEHYGKSPPTQTGAGKIFAMVAEASPGWRKPSTLKAKAQAPYTDPQPFPTTPPPPIPNDAPAEDEDDEEEPDPLWNQEDGPDGPPGPEPPLPDDPGIGGDNLITEQYAMRLFVESHQDNLRYNHSANLWLMWDGHYWRPDQRKLAFAWALNLCRGLAATIQGRGADTNRRVVEKVRFSAAVEQGAKVIPPLATAQNDWDQNHTLLGTPDGVVDLQTAELRPGTREDMITRTTAVTPSEQPDCPVFMAFLRYAMNGDEELVKFLQRYFGYCLTGRTNEEVFLFLFGPGGAGKGTLMETVSHIMGDYVGTVPMEVLAGRNWSPVEYYRASMAGKRMIVANEPERDAYWAEAFIKETTGGDTVSARHPHGRPFAYKPTHKLALLGNHMPKLRGRSTGMERRLRILPFDRKPETPDTDLKAKLIAEAPAILRWMIEGCIAWRKIGLKIPDAVREAGNKYFEGQDAFSRWVDECCDLGQYFETTAAILRTSFNAWAKANGEDEMGGNAFAEAIDQYTPPTGQKALTRGKSNGKRWVRGVTVKPSTSAYP